MRFIRGKTEMLLVMMTLLAIAAGIASWAGRQEVAEQAVPLPPGPAITPSGQQIGVGSFPANMAFSPDGRWLAVTDTGYREYLSILSAEDSHLVSQIPFNAERAGERRSQEALYVGLAFGPRLPAGGYRLYASRGPEDRVSVLTLDDAGQLTDTGTSLDDPPGLLESAGPNFVAGLALSADGARLYAANNETSAATDQQGSVSILDTAANRVIGKARTAGFPYAVAAITKGPDADKKLYVSSERDGVVSVVDVQDPAHARLLRNIPTGDQPIALCLDGLEQRLFVANAGSDTVSVVDTRSDRALRTIPLRPAAARGLPGVTPTGLALTPDETRLYVSLADMNAVAVVDLRGGHYALQGYVPAGWYPTAVAVSPDGRRLFVANAKGTQARNPNKEKAGPNGAWGQYIESILEGTVSTLPAPTEEALPHLTQQALADNFAGRDATTARGASLPKTGIKHVIYIIKENRTYDQVLGDLPQGDGDPSLVLFGRKVTPNQHALAERFALLDNFYCAAEVSADGWNWCNAGMGSEYTERNVPFNYSGRGRGYDFEGENNDVPVNRVGLPDVARAPGGYLWDDCARHGVSYRDYGFFVTFDDYKGPDGKVLIAANEPDEKALVGHTDDSFMQFNMSYADSDAWKILNAPAPRQRRTFGKFDAPSRFAEWKREFDGYVQNGDLPRFVMVRFPRDHTQGTAPGLQSPRGMVADNDYAVGQLVEAVSRSPYWKDTAIFIVEDDAQSGHDHVDAHRSTCYVISPYVRRGTVDHHFYNTDSVLRTMEALLGLPPMCRYDATAPALAVFGAAPGNVERYTALLPAREIIEEFNTSASYRARESAHLDFRQADRVPDAVLNDIIWHSIKGRGNREQLYRTWGGSICVSY
ncbi:MAG TPA: bifunctional YncE family protein/alkaline phosphatase family protein [Chthonomonadaceae bacterium]|nr:bifunctional YncE family protein/alkaline phosphatase family protein [Chthonomonadaceae bacterium]